MNSRIVERMAVIAEAGEFLKIVKSEGLLEHFAKWSGYGYQTVLRASGGKHPTPSHAMSKVILSIKKRKDWVDFLLAYGGPKKHSTHRSRYEVKKMLYFSLREYCRLMDTCTNCINQENNCLLCGKKPAAWTNSDIYSMIK